MLVRWGWLLQRAAPRTTEGAFLDSQPPAFLKDTPGTDEMRCVCVSRGPHRSKLKNQEERRSCPFRSPSGSCQNGTPSNGTAAANRWHFPNQEEQVNADRCRSAVSHLLPLTVAMLHVFAERKKKSANTGVHFFIYLSLKKKKKTDRLPPQCPIVLFMLSRALSSPRIPPV